VDTTPGVNALTMCRQDHNEHLHVMIMAQSDGTVVHGVSLLAPLRLRLVPHCWHELLLSSPRDLFHFSEVFSNRLHDLVGAEHHKMQALSTGNQQMIVLRSVVIAGPDKSKGDGGFKKQLGFVVKVFQPPDDVGFMPGLKLGVMYATDMHQDKCTVAPYVEVRNPLRLLSCGANIVLAKPQASPHAEMVGALERTGAPLAMGQCDLAEGSASPQLGARSVLGARSEGKRDAHCTSAPAAQLPQAAASANVLMFWVDDKVVDTPRVAKRLKTDGETGVKIEYHSDTCESAKTQAEVTAIRKMTLADFIAVQVLGGMSIKELPDAAGQQLRQHKANLWYSLYSFWGQDAIKHLASVLALCLDGHGHGKMNILVQSQHGGCCGRWDMMAVWAAWLLKLFPPKYVSARYMQCC